MTSLAPSGSTCVEAAGGKGAGGVGIGYSEGLCMASMKLLWPNILLDSTSYKNFVRVDPQMFEELLNFVGPRIAEKNTWYRSLHIFYSHSIDPGLRLAITM